MKKKNFTALLLSLLILMMSSCSNGDNTPDETQGTAQTPDTAEQTEAVEETEKSSYDSALEQMGEIKLGGSSVKILSPDPGAHFYYWTSAEENELWYDGSSADILHEAIYRRNLKVEEALEVTIEPVWGGDPGAISSTVDTSVMAGDTDTFNAVLSRLDNELNQAMNGRYLNLYNIDSMNPENEWWDSHIVDSFTIFKTKLYAISGDINYYDDYAVQAILFNKEMCSNIGYDYPYDAVREGKWTMDMLEEMSVAASSDVDGDGVWTLGTDIFGFGDNYDIVPHLIFCYDQQMSQLDGDGVLSVVYPNEANISAVEKICSFASQSNVVSSQTWGNADPFRNNQILFYSEMIGSIPSFRDMDKDFGVIPMPKGSESMDGYKAYVSNGWTTAYAIPSSFSYEQAKDTGYVLELMSAASRDLVTPALYDYLLESKYIRDIDSKEMLTYVFDSKVYDWAGDLQWATVLRNTYSNVLTNGADSFTSSMASITKLLDKSLANMWSKFEELD